MSINKKVLLRQGPVSGKIYALTSYKSLDSLNEAKRSDVTADFDALVCEILFEPDSHKIIEQLDGASKGYVLLPGEREEIEKFRTRLVAIVERHNNAGHGKG